MFFFALLLDTGNTTTTNIVSNHKHDNTHFNNCLSTQLP